MPHADRIWAKNARVRALCADTDALITTRAMQGLGASASAIVDEMGSDASTCVTVATFSRTEAPHGHNMVVDKRQVCLPRVLCVSASRRIGSLKARAYHPRAAGSASPAGGERRSD